MQDVLDIGKWNDSLFKTFLKFIARSRHVCLKTFWIWTFLDKFWIHMRACHVTVFHTQNTFANLVKSYELKGMDSFPLAYPESPTVYVVVFVLIHSSIAILRILKYVHRIHILTLPHIKKVFKNKSRCMKKFYYYYYCAACTEASFKSLHMKVLLLKFEKKIIF